MSTTSTFSQRAMVRSIRTLTVLLVALAGLLATTPAQAAPGDVLPSRARHGITLEILPSISHPGPAADRSVDARTVMVATVTPAEAGRKVVIQRRTATGWWRQKGSALTNATGRAEFSIPTARRPSTYRAVALPFRSLLGRRSGTATSTGWGSPDFVDEFEGATLGPAWEHRIQFYNRWGGRACSKGSPEAVHVRDGALWLGSIPDAATGEQLCTVTASDGTTRQYPFRLNGHVSTQHSADFLYGVAAARMKMHRDLGAHAAFWLQPRGLLTAGTTPWGAEIDVVEWYGETSRRQHLASAVYAPDGSGGKVRYGGAIPRPSRFLASRTDEWWRNYHVFSVEWTPTEYIFRVDRHELWRTDQGVSHDPEFLILSMLSSDYELPWLGEDQDVSQYASVDWVAFWERP